MKYAIGFLAAFVVVAVVVAALRFSGDGPEFNEPPEEAAAHDHGDHNDHTDHADTDDDDHGQAHDDHGNHEADDAADDDPVWDGEVKLDLKNTVDPVSGDEVGADHDAHHHRVYHGFLIHFASEDTGANFHRMPIRYLAKLDLEPTVDGEVIKVDASSYETPDLPDECPFCGMALNEEGDVYILHRNFKIFFG